MWWEALARYLGNEAFRAPVRLLSSPAPRALATANVLTKRAQISVETLERLCEMGELPTGRVQADEPFEAFLDRISTFLDEVAIHHHGETAIAVTHAGVIVASVLTRFGIPRPGTGARLEPAYCSITEWITGENGWTLCRFSDVPIEMF